MSFRLADTLCIMHPLWFHISQIIKEIALFKKPLHQSQKIINQLSCSFLLFQLAIFCKYCGHTFDFLDCHLWEPCQNKLWNSLWSWHLPLMWLLMQCVLEPDPWVRLSLHYILNRNLVTRQHPKGTSTKSPRDKPITHELPLRSMDRWGSAPLSKRWGKAPFL